MEIAIETGTQKGIVATAETTPAAVVAAPVVKRKRTRKEKAPRAPRAPKAKSHLVVLKLDSATRTITMVSDAENNEIQFPDIRAARKYVAATESVTDGAYVYVRILGKNIKHTTNVTKVILK